MPLRIWSYIGGAIALMAFAYASFLVAHTLITGIDVPGYASMMIAVLGLGGLNLLSLGIIGEYLGRVAREVRQRPLYIVAADTHGNAVAVPLVDGPRQTEKDEEWTVQPIRA
jgi:glycosyltransferase involved in cell wall biosynthesis